MDETQYEKVKEDIKSAVKEFRHELREFEGRTVVRKCPVCGTAYGLRFTTASSEVPPFAMGSSRCEHAKLVENAYDDAVGEGFA